MTGPVWCSPVLRVLWRQDVSRYAPRILPAGLVNGDLLLRYPSSTVARMEEAANSETHSSLLKARLPSEPTEGASSPMIRPPPPLLPSSTWRAKYVCENPSEGTSLAAFTPCCAADIDAVLDRVVAASGPQNRSEVSPAVISKRTSLSLLTTLAEVVQEHRGLLAGSEALQTGVPVALVDDAIEEAHTHMLSAIAALSSPTASGSGDLCSDTQHAAGAVMLEKPEVTLCLTPTHFSLARGLRAITGALLKGTSSHVIWCPSSDAAVSAMWLMNKLRERFQEEETKQRKSGESCFICYGRFDILLAGDHANNLLPACCASLARLTKAGHIKHSFLTVVSHGFTPSAASLLSAALDQLRKDAKLPLPLAMTHEQLSIPSVAVARRPPEDPSTDGEREHDAALGEWLLMNSLSPLPLGRRRKAPFKEPTCCTSDCLDCRVSLVFLPAPATSKSVLRHLAQQGIHRMRLGHSLDPTRQFGPLLSAAHLATVRDVIQTATSGGLRVRLSESPAHSVRVPWTQVCGGFDFPLTASQAGGYLFIPAVLYTSLDALAEELSLSSGGGGARTAAAKDNVVSEAARATCFSVQQLTKPLEASYGGNAGACMFVCAYANNEIPVSAGVQRFLSEMKAREDFTWKCLHC